jgi:hypothetical protein
LFPTFSRAWQLFERQALDDVESITEEDMRFLTAYYTGPGWSDRAKEKQLRHEIISLVKNFGGEVMKA